MVTTRATRAKSASATASPVPSPAAPPPAESGPGKRKKKVKVEKIAGTELLKSYYDSLRREEFDQAKFDRWHKQWLLPRIVPDHIEGEDPDNFVDTTPLLAIHPDLFSLLEELVKTEQKEAAFIWFAAYEKHLISPDSAPFPMKPPQPADGEDTDSDEGMFEVQAPRVVIDQEEKENAMDVDALPDMKPDIKPIIRRKRPLDLAGEDEEDDILMPPKKKKKPSRMVQLPGAMCLPALEVDAKLPEADEEEDDRPNWLVPDEPWMKPYRDRLKAHLNSSSKAKMVQIANLRDMEKTEKTVSAGRRLCPRLQGSIKGGILSDQVGVGKTFCTFAFIKIKPTTVVPKQELAKKDPVTQKFKSNATLIITPPHITEQWESEAYKHFKKKGFKVLRIEDTSSHMELSYKDLCQADIVICSSVFLKGAHYQSITSPLFLKKITFASKFMILSKTKKQLHGHWRGIPEKRQFNFKRSLGYNPKIVLTFETESPEVEKKETRNWLVMERKTGGQFRWHLCEVECSVEKTEKWSSKYDEESKEYVDHKEETATQTRVFKKDIYVTPWHTDPQKSLKGFGRDVTVIQVEFRQNLPKKTKDNWHNLILPVGLRKATQKGPLVHHIKWSRVFIDEVHEFFAKPFTQETIRMIAITKALSSEFRWGVTATPFPKPETFIQILRYLGSTLEAEAFKPQFSSMKSYRYPKNFPKLEDMIGTVLIQNGTSPDAHTAFKDMELPEKEETVIYVKPHPYEEFFHDVEMQLGDQDMARAVVSSLMGAYSRRMGKDVREELTLKNFMSHYNSWSQSQLAKAKQGKKSAEDMLKVMEESSHKHKYEIRLAKQKLRTCKNKIKEFYFRLNKLTEKGHDILKRAKKWRKENSVAKKHVISEGSKFAQMISLVKQILEEDSTHRIIMFSQDQTTLRRAEKFLQEEGVSATQMQGTAGRRSKILSNFQDRYTKTGKKIAARSDKRVILLSTKYAASGSDMAYGTHIILMDQFTGTSSEIYAQEKQAIGRALRQGTKDLKDDVKVIRLIVQGSIEHTNYKNQMKALAKRKEDEDDRKRPPRGAPH